MPQAEEHNPIITLKGAGRVYRMGEVDVTALADVDLDVFEGEFLVVIGPSGSGKSTLLNVIGGMDRPTSGRAVFHGLNGDGDMDLVNASDRRLTLYRRRQIGFIFQFFNLIPSLTAQENIQVAVEIVPDPHDPMEMLRQVGLEDRARHFPAQLSGGQQQRVAIARALASNPTLLLCDEPTGNLDRDSGRQVLKLLSDLNKDTGKTVIVITHNTAIGPVGDRVITLRDGRIASVKENDSPTPAEEIDW